MSDPRVNYRDEIEKLEEEFISRSNELDKLYWDYYFSQKDYPLEHLTGEYDYFSNLLDEMTVKDEYYKWISSKDSHPNYCKLSQRLDVLLNLLDYEIDLKRRGSDSDESH